jgi:MFS family permease
MRESAYRNFLLGILMMLAAFNQVDHIALGLVLQNIKVDLHLTDTQLGLLSGIAFSVFYTLMGIPIGRWADRGNRVTIITITTVLWCAAVSLCGLATTLTQLLFIRIGVAVGEAGYFPCAHSLIADYFPRSDRPRAVSRFLLGFPLGAVIANFAAGWLNQLYGWRVTFILMGLPGLVLALVVWLTLKEPRVFEPLLRRNARGASTRHTSIKEVCAALWANSTFRHLLISQSVSCFFVFGIAQWQTAFFIRQYGAETGQLGSFFSLVAVLGIPAMYLGGELASRFAARNERLQLQAIAVLGVCSSIVYACVFLSPNRNLSFVLMGLGAVLAGLSGGPLFATLQTVVPPGMRAISVVIIFFFGNLIGLGLGPLAVGALSDAFRPWAGEASLRGALLALCPLYLWVSWHIWRASKTVFYDIEKTRLDAHTPSPEDLSLATTT